MLAPWFLYEYNSLYKPINLGMLGCCKLYTVGAAKKDSEPRSLVFTISWKVYAFHEIV